MANTIKVEPGGKAVVISELTVINPDFVSVVVGQLASNREQAVLDIIAVGSAAMRRVQTTVDVDFVEKRFVGLRGDFERALSGFEKAALDGIKKTLSPTESGSYTKHIADLVATARKDFQAWTTEFRKCVNDLLDPDKKGSAVGRLEQLLEEATERFEGMFDPDEKGSYTGRLNEQLSSFFGGNGRAGVLGTALNEALRPVLQELRELKEKVEARKAAEHVIAASTLKGRPFEEQVHARLSELARPYGDDVLPIGSGSNGSKTGDFLVTVNGSGRRLVVEARDRKQMSLPAIKNELERQRAERAANLALYVSSGEEMLPQHVGDFQIYEDKLITTFGNLHIAYRLARLLSMTESPGGEMDVSALRAALAKVKEAASSLRNVKSKASQVKKLADGIHTDAEEIETRILALLEDAEAILRANPAS